MQWHEERVVGRDMSAEGLLLPETTLARVEEMNILTSLAEFSRMPANWDGYGALPIDSETIGNCRVALPKLLRRAPAPDLAPKPNGTVSFEWSSNSGEAHLEIGKRRFSFFVKSSVGEAILLEGGASDVPVELGTLIAAIVFPPMRSVAAITKLEYTAGHDRARN